MRFLQVQNEVNLRTASLNPKFTGSYQKEVHFALVCLLYRLFFLRNFLLVIFG